MAVSIMQPPSVQITYPWLCRVEVNALHSLRASEELSLDSMLLSAGAPNRSDICSRNVAIVPEYAIMMFKSRPYLDIQSHVVMGKGVSQLCAASEVIDQGGEPGHEPF
jgi:hypothetical protein